MRANVQDPPRSHRNDHRSTASNRPEGARSQLEGLVNGDLRYFLMARHQGEGKYLEPPYVECLRRHLLTMQEEMREVKSSRGKPSSPDILGDFTAPRVPDEIMCKVYPTALSGSARTWYKKLPSRSIRDFTTYASKFVLHFQGAKPPTKDLSSLQYIKQKRQEPLHEYMKRYHDEVMQMGVYEESKTLRNFWYNLHTGPLWVSFEERAPTSYGEAYDCGMKKIFFEEKCNIKREREKAEDFSEKKKDKKKQDHQEVNFTKRSPKLQKVAFTPIMFTDEDTRDVVYPRDDAMVTTMKIASKDVARILIDTGISVDILFKKAFNKLGLNSVRMQQVTTPLNGFTRDQLMLCGSITLPVAIGEDPAQLITMVDFVVVDHPSSYNVILGRPFLMATKRVVSTYLLKLKFPIDNQVKVVKRD
ncbi:Gag-pol polymerase [Melia azedarach]|uniref:Gag-pol polymerase n=1 Tax=Melia azedarach TaxID=155640 RepID=A0ACC1Y055_MELAZ|nr:Gag-pol polymerase [Melia azedarach]